MEIFTFRKKITSNSTKWIKFKPRKIIKKNKIKIKEFSFTNKNHKLNFVIWIEVREESWNLVSRFSHFLLGSSDWKLYYNEKGTPFYYNTRTGETSYNIQPETPKTDDYSSQTTPLGMNSLIYSLF